MGLDCTVDRTMDMIVFFWLLIRCHGWGAVGLSVCLLIVD